jgi:1,2-diacylglycerol 3-alpha-glucosyltransferase
MNPLKIAYFTDTFYPQINGIVTSVVNLAKFLADKGHKIYIVAPKADQVNKEFEYPGITILRIASIKASFYEDFRWTKILSLKTFKALKLAGIDIIHFETPVGLGIMAVNMAKLLNTPLVGTYHTFISDPRYIQHWKLFKPTILIQNISWFYTNQFYNRTELTTAPSASTIKEMKDNGCNSPLMKTISNGINPEMFDHSGSEFIKKKYNLSGKTVLYVGRVSHEKNIETLLKAFFHAAASNNEIKLMIVGDGPQMEEIRNMASNSPHIEKIILTGAIEHDELVKSGIYNACEIFATASETENQPMTILESQVNGCICVGMNARGIPGMVSHERSGIIVDKGDYQAMGDAFNSILNNTEKMKVMREETLNEVQKHFLSNVVELWEYEYYSLLKNFDGRKLRDRLFFPLKKQENSPLNQSDK